MYNITYNGLKYKNKFKVRYNFNYLRYIMYILIFSNLS